jgi:hypothetical protein
MKTELLLVPGSVAFQECQMRWKCFAAACAAIVSVGLASPAPVGATDLHRAYPSGGGAQQRIIQHHVYAPRYYDHEYHAYGPIDPYAYRPEHRGYYPYYNSGYWRPAHEMRHRPKPYYQLPGYYQAWGYTRPWQNRRWHEENHGRHRLWHW